MLKIFRQILCEMFKYLEVFFDEKFKSQVSLNEDKRKLINDTTTMSTSGKICNSKIN